MTVIDEVKQKTDLIEVVGQYTKLTKAGRTYRGLCPFHSEKHGSFFVYPDRQTWHCFGACATGGDVFSFVMKKEGLDFGEALRLLADKAGVVLPTRGGDEQARDERDELYRVNEAASQYFHNLLLNSSAAAGARAYVERRGISAKIIESFQLGFSLDDWEPLKRYLLERGYSEEVLLAAGLIIKADNGRTYDRFRGRLVFPIRDARGRTMGFGGRALGDEMPKYLNSPQTPVFDKSGTLYGLDLAGPAIRKQEMVIIVEGYVDVIIAHQFDITNVIASMGTSITEKQVAILKKLTKNLVLALDADAAGEEAMLRGVGNENRLDAEVRVALLPEGKDPDEVIKADVVGWRTLIANAVPILDYAFDVTISRLDMKLAKDKAAAVDRLLPIVGEIANPVRRGHYVQKLARLTHTTERNLESALARLRLIGKSSRKEDRADVVARAMAPAKGNPREDHCLALLLRCPELRCQCDKLSAEWFESSENREILAALRQPGDLEALKQALDPSVHERLELLANRALLTNHAEEKYAAHVLALKERYYKNLAAQRAEVYASEVETGGPGADLSRMCQDGIEPSRQLGQIKKARRMGA